MTPPIKKFLTELLQVEVYPTRRQMGEAAGKAAVRAISHAVGKQGSARVIFAAAPSQNEMLATLAADQTVDWPKVTAFHMDEYIGLSPDAPQRFSRYLKSHLFDRAPFASVHFLGWQSPEHECDHYAKLLAEKPIDIVCLGIGENGHLAFNDPPVADFDDPVLVKMVVLDNVCRQQQVNDGCFPDIDAVPKNAVTLTIPALMSAGTLICTVPGKTKHAAVQKTLRDVISTNCPSTILRRHNDCTLFLDVDSFGEMF
ncbi:MAG: glucosamine-6-phosphate deaminase [Planctomycetaceae bacterium]|nr:glucosamine-6-phosphate deaminase [Planctomycetaceae bacterium]